MVIYARFTVPASGFKIGRAFESLSGVTVELERIVPAGSSVVPYIWVEGADPDAVVRATRREGAVERITVLSRERGEPTLYRVVWNPGFRDTATAIAECDLTLLTGRGSEREWTFEFRTRSRESLSRFRELLQRNGTPATLQRLTAGGRSPERSVADLTQQQLEAVRLAAREGYFEEPREVTAETLAEELGISRQAFSGRLRRALKALVNDRLAESAT